MNDIAHQQATREAVRARFRGHQRRICSTKPIYPEGVEREYQRVTDAYMRLLIDVLKRHLPAIQAAAEREASTRQDSVGDLVEMVMQAFRDMGIELENSAQRFRLRQKIERLAHLTRKLSIQEWKRVVHDTLGIDILDDYYMGEFYRTALTQWVDNNVNLIVTIPKTTLGVMQTIVLDGFRNGEATRAIIQKIQSTYGISKGRARFIARDQLAKLNSELARQQQQASGVREYIWASGRDSRVREKHRELNGHRFSWDDPPIVDEKRGRRCHPGMDYQCRCVALPVFDIDTINLPFTGKSDTSP